ncbi:hypothetical protein, partial [Lactobacillus delbrueckii]|uniref:hypothetical protein n=1 Tax=Lactobacillus delbrueckii TaxID=1584 RepID=UPI001F27BF11
GSPPPAAISKPRPSRGFSFRFLFLSSFVYSLIFSIFSENFFPKKACIDRELLYTSKRAYEKARWSSG